MKCEQVQALLVSYLNDETTPSERAMLQAHLSGCLACQKELSRISNMQGQLSSVLQRRAAQALPSSAAWERLEARLAPDAQPAPMQSGSWLSRLAPGVSRITTQLFSGGVTMRKRLILVTGVAILAIAMVAIPLFNSVTPVSAQTILDKASAAQVAAPTEGISHIKTENYFNFEALTENQGTQTVLDSYGDLQSGYFRTVTIDSKTGNVLDAFAYDGANTYSRDYNEQGIKPLTIYRTPQGQVADLKPTGTGDRLDERAIFDQMRNDSKVQLIGEETWKDGRKVYVLQSHQPVKVMVKDGQEQPLGLVTVYFDTSTYKQVGYRMSMEKDGQEILLGSQKILVDETLPVGTSIAWDLSDVQGITIVDDPERIHGDLLPEIISTQELAAQTKSAYLLKAIPEGYSLEISEPQIKPGSTEPYIYIASYRTEANDYFVIQSGVGRSTGAVEENCAVVSGAKSCSAEQSGTPMDDVDETYTTAGGLVLHFMKDFSDPSGRQYTSAFVDAPDGVAFMINSTLPRETVKAWAEQLESVR